MPEYEIRRAYRRRRRFWPRTMQMRRVASALVLVLIVGFGTTAWSVMGAVTAPGNDPISARLAEWGREHYLGFVVTQLETLQYRLNPPRTGGAPDTAMFGASATSAVDRRIGLQAPLATVVTPALKGEGSFKVLQRVKGNAVIQVAYLRPDAVHTSYLTAVVWMSGRHTRLVLHPGTTDPGHLSRWKEQPNLPTSASSGVLAAFNSGFKLVDSKGGFWSRGRGSYPLLPGAASLVVYKDGHADIGTWGTDVAMTPQVVSVRQNLKLLIDHGRVSPSIDTALKTNWGATLGGTFYVWRSGIGITKSGDLVYVIGDTLSAHSLAQILLKAGAVRAMQLDINKLWPSYYWYTPDAKGSLTSHKVLDFARPSDRYFTPNSRDFYAVYAR